MIEIIKKGTKEKCTCKECGCLFSYEEEDIEKQDKFIPGLSCTRMIIRCPQCECVIELSATR